MMDNDRLKYLDELIEHAATWDDVDSILRLIGNRWLSRFDEDRLLRRIKQRTGHGITIMRSGVKGYRREIKPETAAHEMLRVLRERRPGGFTAADARTVVDTYTVYWTDAARWLYALIDRASRDATLAGRGADAGRDAGVRIERGLIEARAQTP